jgi:hypothetical protein
MEQRYAKVGDTYVYEKIELPTVGDVAVIEDAALMELPEYSCSMPTGVFDNKLWRCAMRGEPGAWWVREYVPHPNKPEMCQTVTRRAASPETVALAADGVFWWLGA